VRSQEGIVNTTSLRQVGTFSLAGLIVAGAAVSISLVAITSDHVTERPPTVHVSNGPVRTPPPFVYSESPSGVQSESASPIAGGSADTIERRVKASAATSPAIVPVPGDAPVAESSHSGEESADVACDWPVGATSGRC
jgi:hypothetical protein